MDYIKKINKNNVGLKTTLKEIFKDLNKRIETIEENPSSEDGTETETNPFILKQECEVDLSKATLRNLSGAVVSGKDGTKYHAGGALDVTIDMVNLRDKYGYSVVFDNKFIDGFEGIRNVKLANFKINNVPIEINTQGVVAQDPYLFIKMNYTCTPTRDPNDHSPIDGIVLEDETPISIDVVAPNSTETITLNGYLTIADNRYTIHQL